VIKRAYFMPVIGSVLHRISHEKQTQDAFQSSHLTSVRYGWL